MLAPLKLEENNCQYSTSQVVQVILVDLLMLYPKYHTHLQTQTHTSSPQLFNFFHTHAQLYLNDCLFFRCQVLLYIIFQSPQHHGFQNGLKLLYLLERTKKKLFKKEIFIIIPHEGITEASAAETLKDHHSTKSSGVCAQISIKEFPTICLFKFPNFPAATAVLANVSPPL